MRLVLLMLATLTTQGQILSGIFFATSHRVASPLISHVLLAQNGTTTGINTTGATLLLFAVADQAPQTGTVSDAVGACTAPCNTWNAVSTSGYITLYAAYGGGLHVGSGHTFTVASGGSFVTADISAFSGYKGPVDHSALNDHQFQSTIQAGSITPSANGYLLFAALFGNTSSGPFTIDTGFNLVDTCIFGTGTCSVTFGIGTSYFQQSTAAAINPTWTLGSATFISALIASFPHV